MILTKTIWKYHLNSTNTTTAMPPGRLPDIETTKHFKYQAKPPQKGLVATCKLCGGHGLAKSTNRERRHLDTECLVYPRWMAENSTQRQTKLTAYTINPINPKRKARIDEKLAFAIFKTGRAFTAFEDKA